MAKQKTKIFIVEDALFLKEMLCYLLKDMDIVGCASSVEEALAKIPLAKPNLILLDLVLPKQNGLSLIKESLKQEWALDLKWVICSSLPQKKTKTHLQNKIKEGPLVDYVEKPFDIDELLTAVAGAKPPNGAYSLDKVG